MTVKVKAPVSGGVGQRFHGGNYLHCTPGGVAGQEREGALAVGKRGRQLPLDEEERLSQLPPLEAAP